MTPEQQTVFIFSQSVAALAELEGMKAANTERKLNGQSLAYGEDAFNKVAERFGIGANQVIGYFRL